MVGFMRKIFILIGTLLPIAVQAQDELQVSQLFNWGAYNVGSLTIGQVITNIVSTAQSAIGWVAAAVFFTGAFVYTISAEGENRKNYGKNAMIGSLIALGIVVGASAIMRTVLYFVFG